MLESKDRIIRYLESIPGQDHKIVFIGENGEIYNISGVTISGDQIEFIMHLAKPEVVIYFVYMDGSCRDGVGGFAYSIQAVTDLRQIPPKAFQVEFVSSHIEGPCTNNRAELMAAITALSSIKQSIDQGDHKISSGVPIVCFSDSDYLVKTMCGEFKQKTNLDLWSLLSELSKGRKIVWKHADDKYPEIKRCHNAAFSEVQKCIAESKSV
jgi:ribonuclease HI